MNQILSQIFIFNLKKIYISEILYTYHKESIGLFILKNWLSFLSTK